MLPYIQKKYVKPQNRSAFALLILTVLKRIMAHETLLHVFAF